MQQNLTEGKVLPVLIKYSIPIILGNVFQLIYNFTDSFIVGRILGTKELAGVGVTGSLNFLILGAAMGATSGFCVLVARYFGAKDEEKMKTSIAHGLMLGTLMSFLFSAVSLLLLNQILRWMHTPEDIIQFSYDYISVIFGGIFITFLYNFFSGVLRAVGDSKTPLYFLIFSSLLNIVLDLVFIALLHLGVKGAAIATVFAQAVSVLLSFLYIRRHFGSLLPSQRHFRPDTALAKEMTLLGLAMGFQNSFIAIGNILMQASLNLLGTVYVAANTAASKVLQLFMQPLNTVGFAMTTFASQNLGAKKPERIQKALRATLLIDTLWSVFGILLSLFLGDQLAGLLIKKGAENYDLVIQNGRFFLRWNLLFFLALGPLFIYRNTLMGISSKLAPTISGVVELIVKIFFVLFIIPRYQYPAIALTEPISWVFVLIPLVIAFHKDPNVKLLKASPPGPASKG